MSWKIGVGQISVWFDRWIGDKPLYTKYLHLNHSSFEVQKFIRGTEWERRKLSSILHAEMVRDILRIPAYFSASYNIVWTLTNNGTFTTASCWDIISPRITNPLSNLFGIKPSHLKFHSSFGKCGTIGLFVDAIVQSRMT
ncbi:zf-RVT domain-containing protein [Forsythia ovata]|uniref:Zf-RVT domain-containing protein n=1 Tax=Forsythia ovata TaxID=205694 RepID=A0ABD1S1H0_9LAMI